MNIMFDYIKKTEIASSVFEEAADAMADENIKSRFLDDPKAGLIGAENDPEIKAAAERIPEDDDATPEDVIKAIESTGDEYAEDITGADEYEENVDDKISSGDYQETATEGGTGDEYADDITSADEYEENVDDKISSGDYQETATESDSGDDYPETITSADEYEENLDDKISSGDYQETATEDADDFSYLDF